MNGAYSIDDRTLFSTIAIILFVVFQLTLIFTAITLDGYCLYTFWRPEQFALFSPYWLFSFSIIGLFLWCVYGLYRALFKIRINKLRVAFYICAVGSIFAWLYVMYCFWLAFEFELGEISYKEMAGSGGFIILTEPHQCKSI